MSPILHSWTQDRHPLASLLLLIAGSFLIPAGCSKPKQAPPPPPPRPSSLPDPPVVRDVSLARPTTYYVGESVSIVLDAAGGQIPINWQISGLPESWIRTTSNEGRFYQLTGRIPVGLSEDGLDISIVVTDGIGLRSRPLRLHIETEPKVYDFQPTPTRESEDGLEQEFQMSLRSLPAWDSRLPGRVEIWVDTHGLMGPDATEGSSDTIRLWDVQVPAMDVTHVYAGPDDSQSRSEDQGEVFVLRTKTQQDAISDGKVMLTIRSRNPRARIAKIQVRVY